MFQVLFRTPFRYSLYGFTFTRVQLEDKSQLKAILTVVNAHMESTRLQIACLP